METDQSRHRWHSGTGYSSRARGVEYRLPSPSQAFGQQRCAHLFAVLGELGLSLHGHVSHRFDGKVDGRYRPETSTVEFEAGMDIEPEIRYLVVLHECGHAAHARIDVYETMETRREAELEAWRWAVSRALERPSEHARLQMISDLASHLFDWDDPCDDDRSDRWDAARAEATILVDELLADQHRP